MSWKTLPLPRGRSRAPRRFRAVLAPLVLVLPGSPERLRSVLPVGPLDCARSGCAPVVALDDEYFAAPDGLNPRRCGLHPRFAGVVADSVQRRIGRHRRLLERLVAALRQSLRGGDTGGLRSAITSAASRRRRSASNGLEQAPLNRAVDVHGALGTRVGGVAFRHLMIVPDPKVVTGVPGRTSGVFRQRFGAETITVDEADRNQTGCGRNPSLAHSSAAMAQASGSGALLPVTDVRRRACGRAFLAAKVAHTRFPPQQRRDD